MNWKGFSFKSEIFVNVSAGGDSLKKLENRALKKQVLKREMLKKGIF